MDFHLLQKTLASLGEPKFRLKQCLDTLNNKSSWQEASNLSPYLRQVLTDSVSFCEVMPVQILDSADGSKKALFSLSDGNKIESVLIPAKRSHSVCISTQVGCSCGCKFCATGSLGFTRDLTAGEIADQMLFWRRTYPDLRIDHAILMGMGEPLLNYANVSEALSFLIEHCQISAKNLALSSVGIVAGLKNFLADDKLKGVSLAFSLHAPTQELRETLIPTAKSNPLSELLPLLKSFPDQVFIEYTMLRGLNDTPDHARQLARLLQDQAKFHINLIRYNSGWGGFACSDEGTLLTFRDTLRTLGFDCTRRRSFGADIAGACGQLALRSK